MILGRHPRMREREQQRVDVLITFGCCNYLYNALFATTLFEYCSY
jgi:hypothetical protein